MGEAVTLSEVKKVITEWTDAYEGEYSGFYGLPEQEAEDEVDK